MSIDEWRAGANPSWLGQAVEQDDLPWGQALATTLPKFLARYTLHDSSWRGLFLRAGGVAVATVLWDTHWNRDLVPLVDAYAQEHGWPFLLVRLLVHQVTVGGRKKPSRHLNDIILKAACEPKGGNGESGIHSTELVCLESTFKVIHDASVKVLCLNGSREVAGLSLD